MVSAMTMRAPDGGPEVGSHNRGIPIDPSSSNLPQARIFPVDNRLMCSGTMSHATGAPHSPVVASGGSGERFTADDVAAAGPVAKRTVCELRALDSEIGERGRPVRFRRHRQRALQGPAAAPDARRHHHTADSHVRRVLHPHDRLTRRIPHFAVQRTRRRLRSDDDLGGRACYRERGVRAIGAGPRGLVAGAGQGGGGQAADENQAVGEAGRNHGVGECRNRASHKALPAVAEAQSCGDVPTRLGDRAGRLSGAAASPGCPGAPAGSRDGIPAAGRSASGQPETSRPSRCGAWWNR